VQIGFRTDGLGDRGLVEIMDWLSVAAPSVRALELSTGGYSPSPHCDRESLLSDERRSAALLDVITDRGFELAALNASGDPLHPDPTIAADHDRALRETLELAARLSVERVVALAGCPGSGPESVPVPLCVSGVRRRGLEPTLAWQWEERIIPYWTDIATLARKISSDLRICLELYPSAAVYDVHTFERLSASVDGLAVCLDPSHLFWQQADPLAVVTRLRGCIAFAHGKDTRFQTDKQALNGVLDGAWSEDPHERSWVFGPPGDGHDASWWAAFVRALATSGHDGTIAIECEDPYREPTESIVMAANTLAAAIEAAA
jgi:sugar phosphate isomerase/epimerase